MGTLWQKLTRKKYTPPPAPPEKAAEEKVYNPMKARKGFGVKIKTLDDEDLNYRISDLREIRLDGIVGEAGYMTDFDILARDNNTETRKRLRFVPMNEKDGNLTHNVLLLELLTEFPYNKEYEDSLNSEEGGKEVAEPVLVNGEPQNDTNGEPLMDVFKRVNELTTPWTATVRDLSDDGKFLETGALTYWDFWRDTNDVDGVGILEFYIIEMDGSKARPASGQFKIWRGREIEQNRIQVV